MQTVSMSAKRTILPVILSLTLLGSAPQLVSAATYEREFNKEFTNQTGKKLVIDTGAGDINLRSGGGDTTVIQVKLSVSASSQEKADEILDAIQVELQESETGVAATVRNEGGFSFWKWLFGRRNASAEVHAICPANCDVVLDTGSGNILISSIEGEIFLDTGSGNINGDNLAGSISADTGSGNVTVDRVSGLFVGDTGSGNVTVTNLSGKFAGDTGSGNINASGDISSFDADTGSGNVRIESTISDPNPSTVSTGSGNIRLLLPISLNAVIKAMTNSGEVQSTYPDAFIQSSSESSLELLANNGGALIKAYAGSGDVHLQPRD